jgi:hypothetical protein
VHARDMFSMPEMADERNYYKGKAYFSSCEFSGLRHGSIPYASQGSTIVLCRR